MEDLPLDKLWEWWHELAKREVKLREHYEPLMNESNRIHEKRMQLERLIHLEGEEPEISRKIADAWNETQKGAQIVSAERKPPDVAYDILLQEGKPTHYSVLLERMRRQGVLVGGRDPGSTLIAYLSRDKRFTKAKQSGRGYYQLQQWDVKKE
jgi:hypothetical protein